jgi:Homing endonuclease associated repeat
MPDKKQILNSIAAVARQLGRAPSRSEFISRSGISLHFVLQSFPSWRAAIQAAGLRPHTLNVRIEDTSLLEDWGKTARRNKAVLRNRARLPRHIYRRQGKYNPHTLANRFGGWSSVPRAFRKFAMGKREWADVMALLPAPVARPLSSMSARSQTGRGVVGARDTRARQTNESSVSSIPPKQLQHAPLKDRATYGNPMRLPAFRHEPVNEQGVILLFGMVAKELGYMVETVQSGFPDCEAKRQVAPNRWQRVHIEFEFESRNFRDHGHPVSGCDVIVCWHHNWPDCPDHIEILELCTRIQYLANSED